MEPQQLSYEDGILEGRLRTIEEAHKRVDIRMDDHEKRLTAQERITYALLGALALLQVWPALEVVLKP